MHALCGTPSAVDTFTLQLQMEKTTAIALVDTGSDASFINSTFAVKNKCQIANVYPLQVTAANGLRMNSTSACLSCKYDIQGHHFSSDFRLLEVKGYDIILGTDWIYEHSPVGLNLKTREFSVTKNGKEIITFSEQPWPTGKMIIGTKKLCQLLKNKTVEIAMILNKGNPQVTETKEVKSVPSEIQQILTEFSDVFKELQ